MAEFALKVLGFLELNINNQPVISSFRSDKIRALLVYLVIEAGRPHLRRSLAALLWPEISDRAGLANLRKSLFYLRESLDQAAPGASQLLLTVDRQTVQLNPLNLTCDATQFEQLLADVGRHTHRHYGSCPDCLARLVEAESLYRGDLLSGFSLAGETAFEEWLLFKRVNLQQEAILTLQRLAAIFEQQSNYEQAEIYATRLVLMDPYQEKAVRQLMRILTKTDRRSGALQLYNRLAGRLQAEIGVEPEERTVQLFQQISEGSFLKPAQVYGKMHHFPTQLTPFLGRKDELVQIHRLLLDTRCRLLTILGPGGMGKTRLAIEAATEAADSEHFADGIFFIHLGAVETGDDLPLTLANALMIPPQRSTSLSVQLLDILRSRSCLLLLDNFEHLTSDKQFLADILATAPGVTLLVTSHQPLYLRAEQQVRIGGLSYPERSFSSEDMTEQNRTLTYDAVHLFLRSARQVRPDFVRSSTNLQAIVEISRITRGNPLALEIAAAWVRLMEVQSIAETIKRSLDLLASPMQDLPDRHRSMRAVFDYSWELLTPSEQLTLAKASVFLEPFTLATAVEVLETTMSDIAVLVDKSLLQCPSSGHFELHALLRHYSSEKLAEMTAGSEIEAHVRCKHAEHYLELVARTAPGFSGSEPQAAAAAIRRRKGNVTLAWWWAVEQAAEPEAQQMIVNSLDGIGRFYDFGCLVREGEKMIRGAVVKFESLVRVEKKGETVVSTILNHLLVWQAHFQNRLGDVAAAIQTAQHSLALGPLEPEAAARAKSLLGELLPGIGQFDQADRYQQEALSYYRAVGDESAQALALGRLGVMRWRRGSYPQAVPALEEALAIQETFGNKGALATLSGAIAGIYYEQDRLELAQAYVEQARRLFTEIGSTIGIAQTDGYLALIYLKLGQYDLALSHNQRELEVYRSIGDRQQAAKTIGNRGAILVERGDFTEAIPCYVEAIQLTGDLGLSWHCAMHQSGLALACHEKGDDDRAMALFGIAIPILREHGARYYVVPPLMGQARILSTNGGLPKAQTLLCEALELAGQLNLREYVLEATTLLARLDFLQGKKEQAKCKISDLLADAKGQVERARLHYELWRMDADGEHGRIAYQHYCQLYERLPKYSYRRHLDELQTTVLNQ